MDTQKHRLLRLILALASSLWLCHSARAMGTEDCQGCHSDKSIIDSGGTRLYVDAAQFATTPHADEGCPSCHASVTDSHPDDGAKPSKASCEECHDEVQAQYAKSVHFPNAACTDCHNPHKVKAASEVSGLDVNRVCAQCHDEPATVTSHAKWLPQTTLHLDALPCITCHTGSKNYVITLYLESRSNDKPYRGFKLATSDEIAKLTAGKPLASLIDTNADNAISLGELRKFNQGPLRKSLRLQGVMMPEKMTHSYEILDNRWDCTFCHASGPEAMQKSYVAFPEPTGGYSRVAVEQGAVLDLLYGTPDFYMMGATRNATLSKIGLAIILAGLIMPIGHGTLRFLTRKNRREH